LAEIIAQLHDENGVVTLPGFYDDVLEITAEEREWLAQVLPFSQEEWQEVAASPQSYGDPNYTHYERATVRPTLEINGIAGGYYGDGLKTVLPSEAIAKISCRLVPDQDPKRIVQLLRDHIQHITPPTVTSELIELEEGASAVVLDPQSSAMQAAYRAYQRGWGYDPIFDRSGGSIPITYDMLKIVDEITIMGFGFHTGRAHGPNEHIHIPSLLKGIHTAIAFMEDFATS